MNNMKKILALVIVALLAMTMVSALADPTTPTATITVNGIAKGNTLKLYKVADATVGTDNAIHYTFITSPTLPADYDTVDELKTISSNLDDANAMARAYARVFADANTNPTKTGTNTESTTVTIEDVPAGLYFAIVSGTADTGVVYKSMFFNAAPVANDQNGYDGAVIEIDVKKETVTIEKTEYDPASQKYAHTTDGYSRGDKIPFHIDTLIPSYPDNSKFATFIIADAPTGLDDIITANFTVTVNNTGINASETLDKDTDTYKVEATTNTVDGVEYAGFKVTFAKAFILKHPGEAVQVAYEATLTAPSVASGDTTNTATITYNPNPYEDSTVTPPDTDEQHTYGLVFEKVDDSNPAVPLAGAVFALYDEAGTTPITQNGTALTFTTEVKEYGTDKVKHAYVWWDGLEAGTYTIHEVSAPSGYTTCADFTMTVNATKSTKDNPATDTVEDNYTDDGIKAVNAHGVQLPSTGGIGTTIFYVGGGLLVLLAVVFLVTKRRMNTND